MSSTERDCNTCIHHVQGRSIDDAPPRCWDCIGRMGRFNLDLPLWEAHKDQPMPHPYDEAFRPEESAFKAQVGGQHYKTMKIQPVEFCVANKLDFFQKDIIKYITRRKGDKAKRVEDLNKAKHYLEMYIESVSKGDIE